MLAYWGPVGIMWKTMAETTRPLLIFDFDGTLANTLETGIEIFNDLAESYGLHQITIEEARELAHIFVALLQQRLHDGFQLPELARRHVKRSMH